MTSHFELTGAQLERLYPFYLSFDSDLKITAFSTQLNKISALATGKKVTDIFDVKPAGLLKGHFEDINGRSFQFIKKTDDNARESSVMINGELLFLKSNNQLLALGTPNIYFYNDRKEVTLDQNPITNFISDLQKPDVSAAGYNNDTALEKHVVKHRIGNIAGIALTNADGAIEWVSKDFESSMGQTLEDVRGKRPRDVIYGKQSTYIPSSFVDEMVKKRAAFSFDNIGYNQFGKSFWFRTTVQPIIDASNNITGRYYTFEDITDQKITEHVYKHSYDLWRYATIGSGDGVWGYDIKEQRLQVSDGLKEMLGFTATSDLTLDFFKSIVHPEDFAEILKTFSTLDNRSPHFSFDFRIMHQQLGYQYFRLRGMLMDAFPNAPATFFGTLTNVHAEKEKDQQLKNAALRMEALLQNVNFGVLLETQDRKVSLVNNGLINIFNMPVVPEALIGIDCSQMAYQLDDVFIGDISFSQRVEEILHHKKAVNDELLYTTDKRVLERDYVPIFVNDVYNGHLWRYKDVTQRFKLEHSVKTSDARLSTLMNQLKQAVIFEDPDRNIVYMNGKLLEIVRQITPVVLSQDAKTTEVLNQIKDIFEDPEKELARIENIVAEHKKVENDIVKLSNGTTLSRLFIPLTIDSEETGYLWVYEDITESLEAQQQIIEQKEYYHRILNELPADIVILNTKAQFTFANRSAINDDALREWVIGKTMFDYCQYRNIDISLAIEREHIFTEVLKEMKAHTVFDQYNAGTDKEKYIMRILHPFISPDEKIEFLVAYGTDITEQRKNQKRAEQQEHNIRTLLNVTTDGIFTCDSNLFILFGNPSFEEITGIKHTDKRHRFTDLVAAGDHNKITRLIEMMEAGHEPDTTYVALAVAGETRYVDVAFIISPDNSEGYRYIGKITDITERLTKEQNLNEIIEKERELSQSKSRFIRITSHELRTPLAIIQANAELLQLIQTMPETEQSVARQPIMLSRITKEVIHMTEILNQLMMVSRIETGKLDFVPEQVDLRKVIIDIAADLYQPSNDGRYLVTETPDTDVLVNVDVKLLRHAIVNLTSNAFKYSVQSKESPILRILDHGDKAIIEVQDFGIGIPTEDQGKLFSTFFRAGNTGAINGSGLGLTIVDYAVSLHGGQIEFTSAVNAGTTFRILLNK